VAYKLRDPGNLGSIIRTADAAGATGLVIVGPSVDLYDPHAVRATMGSLFSLPIVRLKDGGPLPFWYEEIRAEGLPLLVAATSAHGRQNYFDADLCRPVVLLVGSERHGLPEPVQAGADTVLRLPMSGRATSLNVSAATAALVFEIVRQRLAKSD
jgi:TrmH family RNA methyltransferase